MGGVEIGPWADDPRRADDDDVVIMQARSHSFLYVESDVPVGVTLDDWRRRTTRPSRRRLLRKR